jgi:hypothetical protein
MASKSAKAKKMSVSNKKAASKKTQKASVSHIALAGTNRTLCGSRGGKRASAAEATCEECGRVAQHAAARARESEASAEGGATETQAPAAGAGEGATADDATTLHETPREPTVAATKASAGSGKERDARLPAVGMVIKKLDRHGAVRCECKVVEGGFEYKGELFKSLSGAAMAAAKDLGVTGQQNGWTWWGLQKQAPRAKNPVQVIEKAWNRYSARVKAISTASLDAGMKRELVDLLESQGRKIVQVADAIAQSA